MTSFASVRHLPLRKDRDGTRPRAYVSSKGFILCDQSNKVCHLTEEQAQKAGAALGNPSIRAYKHTCGYWHNGHWAAA